MTRCIFTGRYMLELFLWGQPNGVTSWSLHCLVLASQEKTLLTFTQCHITVAAQLIRLILQSVSSTEALAEIWRWSLGTAGWLPTSPSGSVKFRAPVSLHYTFCDCMWYITTSSFFTPGSLSAASTTAWSFDHLAAPLEQLGLWAKGHLSGGNEV